MVDKVQQKLHELFIIYSKNLPSKIHEIEVEWQEQLKGWDLSKFQNFHRNVHSLCGSAGTYGYTELGKTARELEVLLKSILGNNKLTNKDKEKISHLITQLKAVLTRESPKKLPYLEAAPVDAPENKIVYILEQNENLVQEISTSLKQVGYETYACKNLTELDRKVRDKAPIAMIIDTFFLNNGGIREILEFQKIQKQPVQLFCILPNEDLLSRLLAIRAGCDAFFPKPLDISYLTQELNHKCSLSLTKGDAYRILIVDDCESLGEFYSLILNQAGMIARAISNPLMLLKELDEFQPDLLLMDIYMPECTGLELAAILRQERSYTKIPIIFLSTEDDKNKKLSAISLGGDDFLTKPISPKDLISAVRSRSKRASILNYYMITDSLTGLLNHSSLLRQLNIEVTRARQKNMPLSFVMIDIDHFKKINDTYGHPWGDVVIKKLATLFLVKLHKDDVIGRYGGEEFALILPGADRKQSKKICDDLRVQFSEFCFNINNTQTFVTFSAGISIFDDEKDSTTMLLEADQALYKAKQLGRNQIIVSGEA